MQEKNNQSSERAYRVVQIEGKITWSIEELWDGGVVRGPFGSQEAAIWREEEIAKAEGFIDDLVLKEAIGEEVSIHDAVEKDSEHKILKYPSRLLYNLRLFLFSH